MAYSDNFPAVRPVFQSDFANGGRIDPRISYSRSTTGTYFGTDKHESSQNLLLQSNTFNTTWASNDVTRTSTASAGPDSSSAAFLVYPNTNSSNARVYQSLTVSSGERGVLSVYAKQTGKTILAIVEQIGTGSLEYSYFDLTDGSDSGSSNHTRIATASGNGYYRCSIALTPNASRTSNVYFYVVDAAGSVTATANGTDGIYLFGAQYETLASGGPTVYNATTTQIHRAYAPTLQTAAINAPRFEHSASDSASAAMGESLGLLIEGSSTNLNAQSDYLGWNGTVSTSVSIEQNVAVAPSGELTAGKLTPIDGATGSAYATVTISATSGQAYTHSFYAKADGQRYIAIYGRTTGGVFGGELVHFDLQTGTVASTSGSGVTASMQSAGNGWYRCIATITASATGTGYFRVYVTDGGSLSVTGNGYGGVLIAHSQIEASSHASSFIATSGSQATRAVDSASVDLSAINQDPIGTDIALATEFRCNVVDTNFRRIAEMRRSSGSGLHKSHQVYNGTAYSYATDTSGTNQVLKSIVSLGDSSHKLVSTQSGASAFAAGDGVAGNTKTSTAEDMVYDRLYIGSDGAGVRQLDGHISRIALYGNSISETNATALSS